MDASRAWSFGAMTGALTALIGCLPGLAVGALVETHSAAYHAARSGGNAIGYWSFMPWRVGFIAGWALTIIPVAIVVAWFQGIRPFRGDPQASEQSKYEEEAAALLGLPASGQPGHGAIRGAGSAVGGLVLGGAGGLAAGLATMAVGLAIGVAFLILPIGALFLILG